MKIQRKIFILLAKWNPRSFLKKALLIFVIFLLNVDFNYAQAELFGSFEVTDQSFATLFTQHRIGQPQNTPWISNYFPYGQHGTAVLLNANGYPDPQGSSPMQAYNLIANQNGDPNAHSWELENHTCDKLSDVDKQGCINWWGHCNGWAAAAIKDPEPIHPVQLKSGSLSVADQKGILSELWLSSNSLFVGNTDKSHSTGDWLTNPQSPGFNSFWDVSPRTFFMIFTTYIGTMKMGIAIDRFTGDEVWNQPIVGYRHLPIRPEDIQSFSKDGKNLWSVSLRTKIYWANDDGIEAGRVSTPFDIHKHTSDSSEIEYPQQLPGGNEYAARLLQYKLFFDGPIEIDSTGTKVTTAGNIVGDGIWAHQENAQSLSFNQLNNSHPDFIWLPTNPFQDIYGGYGNPFITAAVVNEIGSESDTPMPKDPPTKPKSGKSNQSTAFQLIFDLQEMTPENGTDPNPEYVAKKLKRLLLRDKIHSTLRKVDIVFEKEQVLLKITFPSGETKEQLEEFFKDAHLKVVIKPL